jgi:AcrR family transcriptional regulator
MDLDKGKPKPRRPYDASRRREAARRNREAIIAAAEQLFLRDGYSATTVASIAERAGVSADTIYKSFEGKPGLVRAIRERALEGEGPVPAEARSNALQAHDDPRVIIAGWGRLVEEVSPRVSPVLLLVRDAAATDPEVEALRDELDTDRLRRMRDNARRLHGTGRLRTGISVAHTADVLWTYSSPDLYELLVLRRGWTIRRYARFVADAMAGALLPLE